MSDARRACQCGHAGVIETPLLEAMLHMMFDGDIEAGKRALGKIATQDRIGKPAEVARW